VESDHAQSGSQLVESQFAIIYLVVCSPESIVLEQQQQEWKIKLKKKRKEEWSQECYEEMAEEIAEEMAEKKVEEMMEVVAQKEEGNYPRRRCHCSE
jgi:phage protein D